MCRHHQAPNPHAECVAIGIKGGGAVVGLWWGCGIEGNRWGWPLAATVAHAGWLLLLACHVAGTYRCRQTSWIGFNFKTVLR